MGDLKKWPEWAPWQKNDDSIITTLGETTEGVGASQSWTGSDGDGDLVFTKSTQESGIEYDMGFMIEGTRYPAQCAMSYEKVDGGVQVSWTMSGKYGGGFMNKIMAFAMPAMIGEYFEEGLGDLKAKVEAK